MRANTKITRGTVGGSRVKVLFALQALLGLFYLGCVPFLLYVTTTVQAGRGYDPASGVYGLRIGAFVCGVLAVLTLASALGLRKYKLWAYRLGAGIAWLMIAALAFSVWDDKTVDWEMVWIMLPYLAMGILFLLPGTRTQIRALQH